MQSFTTPAIADQVCLTTNELIAMRADVAAYAQSYGQIMLIIGFIVGIGIAYGAPIIYQKYIRK